MKILLASVGAFALLTGAAAAADLPVYQAEPAYVAPVAYDWTGFYVGLNAGYGWADADTRDASATNTDPASLFLPVGTFGSPDRNSSLDGILGGLQAGYNFQFGNWVAGIEADIQASDLDETTSIAAVAVGGPSQENRFELDYFGTVRGRIGYAFDTVLVYGTGGLAYGRAEARNTLTSGFAPATPSISDTDKQNYVGYALGAGVEAAIGGSGWTVKAEYLYIDLGDERFNFNPAPGLTTTSRVDLDMHVVRAGVNYRF